MLLIYAPVYLLRSEIVCLRSDNCYLYEFYMHFIPILYFFSIYLSSEENSYLKPLHPATFKPTISAALYLS